MNTTHYLILTIILLFSLWIGTLIVLFGAMARIRSYQQHARTIRPLVLRQITPVRNPLTHL